MAERYSFSVEAEHRGERLDRFLADRLAVTRSAVERLLEEGAVALSLGQAVKNYRLRGGEEIWVEIADPVPAEAQPEEIPLHIVYEDEDVIVINKPQGMVVHPAAGNPSGTLVNALLYHCGGSLSGVGGVLRPGIVHRIDKDTSGLLVVAKNDFAHHALAEQLKTHAVSRLYHAIAIGNLREDRGTVHKPIGRHPVDRKRMSIAKAGEGREAITHYEVAERFGAFTYLKCQLETGRTHQIRVHMASLGHPLLGDPVYGGDGTRFQALHNAHFAGQFLHAAVLRLIHPRTEREMCFTAPLPQNFDTVLALLRKEYC
ncbi:MAG: RluA family pseudouridine synthase [Ruminococcaceae bacterium]|nr:RluA family pseudouridine synthase [Oscillospiraceae bacterium]